MKNIFCIENPCNYPICTIQNVKYNSGSFSYHQFSNDEIKLSLLKQLGLYTKTDATCRPLAYKDSSGVILDTCVVEGFNLYSIENRFCMQLVIKTISSQQYIPINSIYLKDMQKNSFGLSSCEEE